MAKLPQEFLDRMKVQLGDEYGDFEKSMNEKGYAGLRVNTGKISVKEFLSLTPFSLTPVPWTENGFYYRKEDPVTKHPHYYAGLYYVQEPSAMLPASRLPVTPGDMVLDLCAAPGGKATELSVRLKGDGLLVANDASASRAKALVKNLALWGTENGCITGEMPQKLLDTFGCFFDKILVDAPCSGEGMFRKDSSLVDAWVEKGPDGYAGLQLDILRCAVKMLKPGGILGYSTCTFSEEEDEGVVRKLLAEESGLTMLQPQMTEGFASGKHPCEKAIRLWPHRVKGVGHFFALFKKAGEPIPPVSIDEAEIRKSQRRMPECIKDFLRDIPSALWQNKVYQEIGEQCFLLPPYHLPKNLRYLRTGILVGTVKKGRFEPSQPLAMLLKASDYPSVLNLPASDERVIRYLKGETLELEEQEEKRLKGWVLLCVDGYGLGWAKCAGGNLKNKYYSGWRLQ